MTNPAPQPLAPRSRYTASAICRPTLLQTFVPWITLWSDEKASLDFKPCPYAEGRMAHWLPTLRTGQPLFREKHSVRERMAVALALCSVCGRSMKRGDRWVFVFSAPVLHGHHVLPESPSHKACADKALRLCPALPRLKLKPVRLPPKCTPGVFYEEFPSDPGFVKTSHLVVDPVTFAKLSVEPVT